MIRSLLFTIGVFLALGFVFCSQPASAAELLTSAQSASVLVPTAATASISGRVMTPEGAAIRNATVNVVDQTGGSRVVRTNSFGYFRLDAVEAGQTYFVSVTAKAWSFQPIVVSVVDDVTELEIVAESTGKSSSDISEPTPPKIELVTDSSIAFLR